MPVAADTLRIEVTSADIEAAREFRRTHRYDESKNVQTQPVYNAERDCPFGQALQRMGYFGIRVHPDFLSVQRKPYHWMLPDHYEATETIRRAMRTWDRRGKMAPHTFITRSYQQSRSLKRG